MALTRTPPHLGTLIVLTGLSVLTLNMFLPSLPAMTRSFGVDQGIMAVAVSGYMLVAAVMQLIVGPVSDRLGRRPVLLGALGLFTLASVGCFLAQDLWWFLAFRMLQSGAVAGAVVSSAVIRDLWSDTEAAARLGMVGAAMALAPMLGPMLGGFLDAAFGWRAVFALYAGLGAGALMLALLDLGETRPARAIGSRGGSVAPLLRSGRFWAYALCLTFSVGAFHIFLAGAPFVANAHFNLSSAQPGIGLGSLTGAFLLGATLPARLAPLLGIAPLILAGRVSGGLGLTLGLVAFGLGLFHPLVLFGATIMVGFGNGLTVANAQAGALSVAPHLAGTAAGFAGALMVAGGAGLTALTLRALGQDAAPERLLALMMASVVLSLIFALAALAMERRARRAAVPHG